MSLYETQEYLAENYPIDKYSKADLVDIEKRASLEEYRSQVEKWKDLAWNERIDDKTLKSNIASLQTEFIQWFKDLELWERNTDPIKEIDEWD